VDYSRFPTPIVVCTEIIKRFKHSQLRLPLRRINSTNQSPQEAQYQDEFYRCTCALLSGNCLPSPEFGIRTKSGGGSIDFFLPGYNWGIEIIAEGDRLKQHFDRFQKGAYSAWLKAGILMDFLMLDFRTKQPSTPHPGKYFSLILLQIALLIT